MSRAVISTIGALLVARIALQCGEVQAEPTIAIAVPKDVQVDTLFALSREKPSSVSADIAFDIDPDGLPVVADGAAMKILGSSDQLLTLGVLLIDDFAFMRDSSLLLVTQSHLASLSSKGVVLSLALPGSGMRIRPAGDDTACVFGGPSEPESRNVYLLSREATVTKLASLPAPVTAIAGDGVTTYVATDKAILRIALNELARVLLKTPDPIISLEIAPRQGLFYATKAGVGYIDRNGDAYEFMRGEGGLLRLRGSMLFVLLSNGQLLRFGPVTAFEQSQK